MSAHYLNSLTPTPDRVLSATIPLFLEPIHPNPLNAQVNRSCHLSTILMHWHHRLYSHYELLLPLLTLVISCTSRSSIASSRWNSPINEQLLLAAPAAQKLHSMNPSFAFRSQSIESNRPIKISNYTRTSPNLIFLFNQKQLSKLILHDKHNIIKRLLSIC